MGRARTRAFGGREQARLAARLWALWRLDVTVSVSARRGWVFTWKIPLARQRACRGSNWNICGWRFTMGPRPRLEPSAVAMLPRVRMSSDVCGSDIPREEDPGSGCPRVRVRMSAGPIFREKKTPGPDVRFREKKTPGPDVRGSGPIFREKRRRPRVRMSAGPPSERRPRVRMSGPRARRRPRVRMSVPRSARRRPRVRMSGSARREEDPGSGCPGPDVRGSDIPREEDPGSSGPPDVPGTRRHQRRLLEPATRPRTV